MKNSRVKPVYRYVTDAILALHLSENAILDVTSYFPRFFFLCFEISPMFLNSPEGVVRSPIHLCCIGHDFFCFCRIRDQIDICTSVFVFFLLDVP